MKRTIHMETTEVPVERTITEIQMVLKKHGMRRMNMNYDISGEVESVFFTLMMQVPGQVDLPQEVPYKLPANYEALLVLATRGETKYLKKGDEVHARKIAWRQVLRWIEAQFALVELEMVRPEEVFLPYMVIDEKETTMYEKVLQTGFQGFLLQEGTK